MLAREAAGGFPPGLYASFAMLEHMPREERQPILEQLVQQFPSHAPGVGGACQFLADPAECLAATEQGLGACPDPYTLGMLLVRKAFALNGLGGQGRRWRFCNGWSRAPASCCPPTRSRISPLPPFAETRAPD